MTLVSYDEAPLASAVIERDHLICKDCRVSMAEHLDGFSLADLAGLADDHYDDCDGGEKPDD